MKKKIDFKEGDEVIVIEYPPEIIELEDFRNTLLNRDKSFDKVWCKAEKNNTPVIDRAVVVSFTKNKGSYQEVEIKFFNSQSSVKLIYSDKWRLCDAQGFHLYNKRAAYYTLTLAK